MLVVIVGHPTARASAAERPNASGSIEATAVTSGAEQPPPPSDLPPSGTATTDPAAIASEPIPPAAADPAAENIFGAAEELDRVLAVRDDALSLERAPAPG